MKNQNSSKVMKIKRIFEESLVNGSLNNGLILKRYFSAYGLEDHYCVRDDEGKNKLLFVVWKSDREAWRFAQEFIKSHNINVVEE